MPAVSDLTRQRIDYVTEPDGKVRAILTVTLPGGIVKRFESVIDPNAADVAGDEIGSLFGGLGRFLKKAGKTIGHVAKAIAHSKVLMMAAGALASAIPFAGPIIGPAMMIASASLGVAGKLSKAHLFAAHGSHAAAKLLTNEAVADAHRLTSSPAAAAGLLKVANDKRLALAKHAGVPDAPAPAPARAVSVTRTPAPAPADPLAAARMGRVRSNRGGAVTPAELIDAHSSGRIFWVS